MKKITVLFLLAVFAVASGGTCSAQGGNGNCGGLMEIVADLPYEEIDSAELDDLMFMREEEKLARDVYAAMDELWGMRIFGQIMWSEQNHMDALFAVIQKYELPDPVGDNPAGVFTDPALQSLFDQLLDRGSQSLIDALSVGATIEDLDIYDLHGALGRADNVDLRTVYQNLQKGSRNHLRSFVNVLERNGESYEPEYLSVAEFEEIVSSPMESGMLDADGEPIDCGGSGGGGGQGPGPERQQRHRHHHQHDNNTGFGTN